MRDSVKEFVSDVIETVPLKEPIYEFGSYLVPEQIELANLRSLFPGKEYIGCDMRGGPGVDQILNLHNIDLPPATAGTVLCLDTLEHVEYPRKAMEEIHRILKPGGIVIISSVMNYPIHDFPFDYWRFTPEAFRSLLKIFASIYVNHAGENDFPHTIVGIAGKGTKYDFTALKQKGNDWQRKWTEPESPKNLSGKLKREAKRIMHQIINPLKNH